MRHAGPFESHVREAIAFNRVRAQHYAALTGGLSDGVFRRYLIAETLVLPFAAWFDRQAAPYEEAGVPILSSVFESMQSVPPLSGTREPQKDDGWSPHSREMARKLESAFRANGFHALAKTTNDCLHLLAMRPWRDCMLTHQIESLRRVANVSPVNLQAATCAGMLRPEGLIRCFVRFHLRGVRAASWVDKPALQLQLLGFPILANDLPHITPWPAGGMWAESVDC